MIERSLRVPEAFSPIFDRHFRAIHRHLARRVGRECADDLAAQTFTVAFERRAGALRRGAGLGLRRFNELGVWPEVLLSLGLVSGRQRALIANQVTEEAAMTIYAASMTDSRPTVQEHEEVSEQLRATAARQDRDRTLSMSERLERVHQLCAQLARLEPVRPKSR